MFRYLPFVPLCLNVWLNPYSQKIANKLVATVAKLKKDNFKMESKLNSLQKKTRATESRIGAKKIRIGKVKKSEEN